MRVGWCCDDPGYTGGAEMTQAEFRAAAPEDVEVIDCPPGAVEPGLDVYVFGNCTLYSPDDLRATGSAPRVKYLNDVWPAGDAEVRRELVRTARLIFCSSLHREWMGLDGLVIPPPVDLRPFRPNRQSRRSAKRAGTCSVAQWRNPGKGAHLLSEWARENGPVDIYGPGPFRPSGNVNDCRALEPDEVAPTLWRYERFVFLPSEPEPFCRSVVEAHAAGLKVITNRNVGALEYLDHPERLESAAEDFWQVIA